jgi:hypothetical protein
MIILNDYILCDIKYNISTFISIYVTRTIRGKTKGSMRARPLDLMEIPGKTEKGMMSFWDNQGGALYRHSRPA